MKKFLLALVLSVVSISMYSQTNKNLPKAYEINENHTIEVFINKRGKITVDNKKISLKDLDKIIADIREKRGVVKFAKEYAPSEKFSESNLALQKALRKYQPIVKTYTDKTFSKLMLQ